MVGSPCDYTVLVLIVGLSQYLSSVVTTVGSRVLLSLMWVTGRNFVSPTLHLEPYPAWSRLSKYCDDSS